MLVIKYDQPERISLQIAYTITIWFMSFTIEHPVERHNAEGYVDVVGLALMGIASWRCKSCH